MPYIKENDRKKFESLLQMVPDINSAGELNYLITSIFKIYLEDNGKNYAHINDIIGVLECAKLEFYRRLAAPYEDVKIKENGDCYNEDK